MIKDQLLKLAGLDKKPTVTPKPVVKKKPVTPIDKIIEEGVVNNRREGDARKEFLKKNPVRPISVKTAYGSAPFTPTDDEHIAYRKADKTGKLKMLQGWQAEAEAQYKKEGRSPVSRVGDAKGAYTEPKDVSGLDLAVQVVNNAFANTAGYKEAKGVAAAVGGKAVEPLRDAAKGYRKTLDTEPKAQDDITSSLIKSVMNAPASFVDSVADVADPKVDAVGTMTAGAEVLADLIPSAAGAKSAIKVARVASTASKATKAVSGVSDALKNVPDLPLTGKQKAFQDLNDVVEKAKKPEYTVKADGQVIPKTPKEQAFDSLREVVESANPTAKTTVTQDVPFTRAANASTDADRELFGVAKAGGVNPETFKGWLDDAVKKGYDQPEYITRTAKDVLDNPRALSPEETAGFTRRLAVLKNEHAQAKAAGLGPEVTTRIQDEATEIFDTLKKSGSEAARGLVSRKLAVNEDLDLVSVRYRAEQAKGSPLTADEVSMLEKRVQDLETEKVGQQAKIDSLIAELAKAQDVRATIRRVGTTKSQTSSARVQARDEVLKALSTVNAGVPVEAAPAFAKYIKATIKDGAKTVEDLIKASKADGIPNVDAEDILNALTARTGTRSLSDLQKAKKGLMSELAGLRSKRATETAIKNVQAKIADLNEQIRTGNYQEKAPVKAREIDTELFRLRQIKKLKEARVKAAIEEMRPKTFAEKTNSVLSEMKLLNPASRATDLAANASNMGMTILETPFRYAADRLVSKLIGKGHLQSFSGNFDRMQRTIERVKASVPGEWRKIVENLDPATKAKFGAARGLGGKAAGATDLPFRLVHREYMADLLADYKAREILPKSASKTDIADMRETILRNIEDHPDIIMQSEEYALWKTFNNDNGVSRGLSAVRRTMSPASGVFFDEFVARFSKVITNVVGDQLDRTGFGIVRGVYNALKYGKNLTAVQRAIINDQIAKGLTGVPIMLLGYWLHDKVDFNVKGERFKYSDHGDYPRLGAPIQIFLLGADLANAKKTMGDKALGFQTSQTLKAVTSTPLVSNLGDILDVVENPTPDGMIDYGARKLSNALIPGGVRDVAKRMDNGVFDTGKGIEREKYDKGTKAKATRGELNAMWAILRGEFQSKLPFARQRLPVKVSSSKPSKKASPRLAKFSD